MSILFYHEGHEAHEEYKSIFMSFMRFMVLNENLNWGTNYEQTKLENSDIPE